MVVCGLAILICFAGALVGHENQRAATKLFSPLVGAELRLPAGATAEVKLNPNFEHGFLAVKGQVLIDDVPVDLHNMSYHETGQDVLRLANQGDRETILIMLGGEPFEEPIVMWWNFIERSHEPYEFSHAEPADLWVMKLSKAMLGGRIRSPDRFCSLQFDATNGANGLFVDMVHLIPARYDSMTEETRLIVGRQLVDLLALAIQSDERVLTSGNSTVRTAHLARIESFVRRHIDDPDLGPEEVAAGCGISVRYLHELLRDTNTTLGQWIRDTRLQAAMEDLKNPADRRAIGEIAYARGFTDQAQFSRAFRARFGLSPSEARGRA